MSNLSVTLERIANDEGFVLHAEYRFHPTRRWRFDYADPKQKIGIECEGGVWSMGRHNRGQGYIKDTKKYNAAAVLGWRILRYCTEMDIIECFPSDYRALRGTKLKLKKHVV